MRFSVVIPVYNVADYLKKCVASVLDNDCSDCEIILVDDGSTDGISGALCDALAAERPELIRVIHQQNKGLGGARNTGIAAARGEYLLFVDSDDTVCPDTLAVLSAAVEKNPADIYSFAMYGDDGAGHLTQIQTSEQYPEPFCLAQKPEFLLSLPAAWARLWKRKLFLEHQIEYPERQWYEDICTSTKLFAVAERIVTLPQPLYRYLSRPGSITRNSNVSRNREILDAFESILNWFEAQGLRAQYETVLCRLAIDHVLIAASVRVARIDRGAPLLAELRQYMERRFPDYAANPYIDRLPRSKKMAYRLIQGRRYGLLAAMFALKDKLSGV